MYTFIKLLTKYKCGYNIIDKTLSSLYKGV